jgi:glycosyltransferase involved in cell wall biosynthesis
MVSSNFKGADKQDTSLSIVIGVYNDWAPLRQCLRSLSAQVDAPKFEVIIVNDGSKDDAPEFIRDCDQRYPLKLITQPHSGISTARNRGIEASIGSTLLFTDADCKFERDCLFQLNSTLMRAADKDYFQLHLAGDCSGIVGRTEELRLLTVQSHLLQPNGCIRYLNTAGFAVRRTRANSHKEFFDPSVVRAEDTLLLAGLVQTNELPFFVSDAIVHHTIPLSLLPCLQKDLRAAYLEERTYEIIASNGVKIRVGFRERLRMLLTMWKASKEHSIGRFACVMLTVRQVLRLMASFAYRCFHTQS